jgi:hypothetical protein
MVDKVTERQAKFLIWLVGVLLAVLTFVSGWSKVESNQTARDLQVFKEKSTADFVSMERYKADCDRDRTDLQRVESTLVSLGVKIDTALIAIRRP